MVCMCYKMSQVLEATFRLLVWVVLIASPAPQALAADADGCAQLQAEATSLTTNTVRTVRTRVELGSDRGQAFGSLWEARTAEGIPIAGAGFLSAYNTQDRSDRRTLHVYLRMADETAPASAVSPAIELLPRPSSDAGTYLYGFDGKLFSYGRNALDQGLRVWQPDLRAWLIDAQTPPLAIQVDGRTMSASPTQINFDGRCVLDVAPNDSRIGEWYYADGTLLVRQFSVNSSNEFNRLIAYPWSPDQNQSVDLASGVALSLSKPGEFIYAFGQRPLGSERWIVAASNQGGVHLLGSGRDWTTLRAPDGKSFQIYSTINLEDRLLLGQYPTGELFQIAHQQLERLADWPPAMPSVSRNAREAQTMAIYGGDLYVGVWPWGELWRRDMAAQQWRFEGRLFSHPEPTDTTTHPYENETKLLDPVLNRWGQRITSLVPLGDSLYISTSAKGPNPYEDKFAFLSGGKYLEYGAVHRLRRPGCLAVPIRWSKETTELEFQFSRNRIEVIQDNVSLGSATWDADCPTDLTNWAITLGQGVFGAFAGKKVELVTTDSDRDRRQSQPSADPTRNHEHRPLRAAYVHLHRLLPPDSDSAQQQAVLEAQVDAMQRFGLNTIMPFVSNSSGEAHYQSQYMPHHFSASDPLAILARLTRERGMAFYPVLPVVVSGGTQPAGILHQNPHWALRDLAGKTLGYLSPAHPQARQWLADIVRDVVLNYQPDGIVLDYLRYANQPHQLDAASQQRFMHSLPAGVTDEQQRQLFQEFKEAELTELARLLSQTARDHHPSIRLAAYVWGAHVARKHTIAQVWPRWVELGLLDMINVSGYCHRETYGDAFMSQFRQRLQQAVELNQQLVKPAELTFALGVKTSHGSIHSADDARNYLDAAEQLGVPGVAYFTWEYLQPYVDQLQGR
ncbi:MAG: family 10 glycosylhydrolase [Pirellulaceae bacterium]|nr:family 10 glycosylhydrolase [Pirellulaceae bacterium]